MKQLIKGTLENLEFTAHFVKFELSDDMNVLTTLFITVKNEITKKEIGFNFTRTDGEAWIKSENLIVGTKILNKEILITLIKLFLCDLQLMKCNNYDLKRFRANCFGFNQVNIANEKIEKEYRYYISALNDFKDVYNGNIEEMYANLDNIIVIL